MFAVQDAVIQEVYNSLSTQEYKATIKEAMTALGFGAKLSMGTWRSDTGEENQSSLFEVFDRDTVVLKRFVECNLVKTFNSEQQTLSKYIVAKFSGDAVWQAEMTAEQQRKKHDLQCLFRQYQKQYRDLERCAQKGVRWLCSLLVQMPRS